MSEHLAQIAEAQQVTSDSEDCENSDFFTEEPLHRASNIRIPSNGTVVELDSYSGFELGSVLEVDTDDNNVSEPCSDSDSDDSIDTTIDDSGETTLNHNLQHWALQFNITHNALRALLLILHKQHPHPDLPNDPRSLLGTIGLSSKLESVVAISGGQYIHFGIEEMLLQKLRQVLLVDETIIDVQMNIDGLPIYKSTRDQFWPILLRVVKPFQTEVFTVGIYHGKSKPTDLTFLGAFIEEFT